MPVTPTSAPVLTPQANQSKPIPGPREWPWIGSLPTVGSGILEFMTTTAQTYGPMALFTAFGRRMVLISDPEVIREVLVERVDEFPKAKHDIDVLSPFLGQGLLTNHGENHRQRRRLAQPAFHAKRIQSYANIMVNYTQAMLDSWEPGTTRNMSEEMVQLTLLIVAKTLFNEEPERMRAMVGAVGHNMHEMQAIVDSDFDAPFLLPLWVPTPHNARRKSVRNSFHQIIETVIADRMAGAVAGKVEDRGDLLSMLLLTQDESGVGLNREQVRDELITFMAAGHETTSNAMAWTFYLLAQHPQVAAKLHAEMDTTLQGRAATLADLSNLPYTQMVIKESMRLYPPAWTLNLREVTEDTALGGYALAKGTTLFIVPYVMHRLPQYWDAPEQFQPERWTPELDATLPRYIYMPFGGGPRVCIGNSFAMMEAQLILATISQRFAPELLPGYVAEPLPQITLSIKDGLPMRLTPR